MVKAAGLCILFSAADRPSDGLKERRGCGGECRWRFCKMCFVYRFETQFYSLPEIGSFLGAVSPHVVKGNTPPLDTCFHAVYHSCGYVRRILQFFTGLIDMELPLNSGMDVIFCNFTDFIF